MEKEGSPLLADAPSEGAEETKEEEGASPEAAEGEEKKEDDLTAEQIAALAADPRIAKAALQGPEGSTMLDQMIEKVMGEGREEGKVIAKQEAVTEAAQRTELETLKAALKANADGDPQALATIFAEKLAHEEAMKPIRDEFAKEGQEQLYARMDDAVIAAGLGPVAQSLTPKELQQLNRDRYRTDEDHIKATFTYLHEKQKVLSGKKPASKEDKDESKAKRHIQAAVAGRDNGVPATNTGKAGESQEVSLGDYLNEKR